jgi:flagellar M-ring protein FliF
MPPSILALLARFRALPTAIRIGSLIAALLVIVASVAIGSFARPAATPLFATALHSEQLSEVEEQLAAWGTAFTPTTDNVSVDASKRNDLLLRLSLAGVPHAHVETSDEALANVGVLTPQAVVDAQARSGLAGDIELALRSVNGVDDAHVIVAPAQAGEFADQSARPGTASVRVRLHPGASLSREAVGGIRRFVAASVTGLDPANVTILDDRGIALGDEPAGQDAGEVEQALQSALDAAFGSGVAIARVHADYTTQASEDRDTRREALGGDPIDRTASDERYSASQKTYAKSDEHDERGSDTRERIVKSESGAIARMSTAVLVDESHHLDLAAVRELAAASVGFDPHRGDQLSVAVVDFHHTLQPRADGWFALYGLLAQLLPTLAVLSAAGIVVRIALPHLTQLVRTAVERDAIARTTQTVAGYAPARVHSALAGEPAHAAAAIISALPAATAAAVLQLYPQHEREAIVIRMQRAHSTFVPSAQEVLGQHA